MTSISAINLAPSSPAIPEPATGGGKSVNQFKAPLAKPSEGHPAMPGLVSRNAKSEPSITKSHALRIKKDIGNLPPVADSLDALMPRESARPNFSGMPPEIIEHIAQKANPADVVALGLTNKKNGAVLQVQISQIRRRNAELDVAIQNIKDPGQYDKARSMVGAIDPSFRAKRVDALARKSNLSGKNPVSTFSDLAEILKGASPDSRGNAIRAMSELIRTLETQYGPLVRDQEEAHDTLLAMAKEMSPELQREVLRALCYSPAPEASNAKAREALNELR
jgi:hypothetical protein